MLQAFEGNAYNQIQTVIFGGGGGRGRAYPEAVRLFYQKYGGNNLKIKKVFGTSVGSIAALMVALGIPPEECGEVLAKMDLGSFQNFSWNPVIMLKRIWRMGSLFTSEGMIKAVGEILKRYTGNKDITFFELREFSKRSPFGEKDLKVVVTNIRTGKPFIFSADMTPHAKIAYAVSRSAAIPFAYPIEEGLTDGGVVANYPIRLVLEEEFKENALKPPQYRKTREQILKSILGFAVIDSDVANTLFGKQAPPPRGVFAIFKRIISLIFNHELLHMPDDVKARTVFIHTKEFSPAKFVITEDEQERLNAMAKKALDFHAPREIEGRLFKKGACNLLDGSLKETLQALSQKANHVAFTQEGEYVFKFLGKDALQRTSQSHKQALQCSDVFNTHIENIGGPGQLNTPLFDYITAFFSFRNEPIKEAYQMRFKLKSGTKIFEAFGNERGNEKPYHTFWSRFGL